MEATAWPSPPTNRFASVISRGGADRASAAPRESRHRSRERLHARLHAHPVAGLTREEIDRHFASMPAHYWEGVTKSELIWGLETIHAFSKKGGYGSGGQGLAVAEARHYPERGFSKVMICTWDRPGLLAKIAAAFTVLRINVLHAGAYTRSDGLALDLFEVTEIEHGKPGSSSRLAELVFLVEGALADPPRFVSVWASEFHKVLHRPPGRAPRVEIDNCAVGEQTLIRLEASDRLGLLHDVLQALTECGLNIVEAVVETDESIASDLFYVTDFKGRKIWERAQLETIRRAVMNAAS